MFKFTLFLIACYCLLTWLDDAQATNLSTWYAATPYQRCIEAYEGTTTATQCTLLKTTKDK